MGVGHIFNIKNRNSLFKSNFKPGISKNQEVKGILLIPIDFPDGGILTISNNSISYSSPISGKRSNFENENYIKYDNQIKTYDFNRANGNLLLIVLDNNHSFLYTLNGGLKKIYSFNIFQLHVNLKTFHPSIITSCIILDDKNIIYGTSSKDIYLYDLSLSILNNISFKSKMNSTSDLASRKTTFQSFKNDSIMFFHKLTPRGMVNLSTENINFLLNKDEPTNEELFEKLDNVFSEEINEDEEFDNRSMSSEESYKNSQYSKYSMYSQTSNKLSSCRNYNENGYKKIFISVKNSLLIFIYVNEVLNTSSIELYELKSLSYLSLFKKINGQIEFSQYVTSQFTENLIGLIYNNESYYIEVWDVTNKNKISSNKLSFSNISSDLSITAFKVISLLDSSLDVKHKLENDQKIQVFYVIIGYSNGKLELYTINNKYYTYKYENESENEYHNEEKSDQNENLLFPSNFFYVFEEKASTKRKITYINYDLYFDILMIGDSEFMIYIIEKASIIIKSKTNTFKSTFELFSLSHKKDFHFKEPNRKKGKEMKGKCKEVFKRKIISSGRVPFFSFDHDLLYDEGNIILYDKGKKISVLYCESDSNSSNSDDD